MRKFFRVTFLWVLLLPYVLIFVGAASNQLVLIANHGKFPVMMNGYESSQEIVKVDVIDDRGHCLMTSDTHLNLLADIFPLGDGTYSIGDFVLMLGYWLDGFCFYVWLALVVNSLLKKATNYEQKQC